MALAPAQQIQNFCKYCKCQPPSFYIEAAGPDRGSKGFVCRVTLHAVKTEEGSTEHHHCEGAGASKKAAKADANQQALAFLEQQGLYNCFKSAMQRKAEPVSIREAIQTSLSDEVGSSALSSWQGHEGSWHRTTVHLHIFLVLCPQHEALGLHTEGRPVCMARDKSTCCRAYSKTASWVGSSHWPIQAAGLVAQPSTVHHAAMPRKKALLSTGNAGADESAPSEGPVCTAEDSPSCCRVAKQVVRWSGARCRVQTQLHSFTAVQ